MKKYNKIVVTHAYSDSNKGDSAISVCTINAILSANPKNIIVMQSTFRESDPDFKHHNRFLLKEKVTIEEGIVPSPYIGSDKHFLSDLFAFIRLFFSFAQYCVALYFPYCPKWLCRKQLNAVNRIKNADIIVLKGGQYIYNNSESLRGWFFLWRTLLPIKCATKFKKKIVLFGQSIGPFKTKRSWAYVLKTLLKCHKIVLREKLSLSMFENEGLRGDKFVLSPDLAFLITPELIPPIEIGFPKKDKGILGVTIVNWSFPNNDNPKLAKENYINNLVEAIKAISLKYEIIPVLIPQVIVRHHGASDLDLIYQIQKLLSALHIPSHVVKNDYSAPQMAALYGQCQLLIGTRLHSCILAATANIPIIAIRYQGFKTQGVMKTLGMSGYVHDINTLSSKELCQSADSIMSNYNDVVNTINSNVKKMRANLIKISNELFS